MLEIDPQYMDALIGKGALLHRLGMADVTAQCFAIAQSIEPEMCTQPFGRHAISLV